MKRWLVWLIPTVVLLGLVGWRLTTRNAQPGGGPPGAQRGAGGPGGGGGGGGGGQRGPASVEVAVAKKGTIVNTLQSVGNVESPFKVAISPKSSGRIDYLTAREGDVVTPGEVLVRIDPTEIQGQVLQQQANVAEARSRLAQASLTQGSTAVGVTSQIQQQKATLTSAQADLNQVRRNYDAQVAAAHSQVTDAQAKVASAQAQVRNAQAQVTQQTANLRNAQIKLDRITSLYKQGFVAAQDVDDAKTTVDVQQGALQVAQGQESAARSGVESAKAVLNSATQNEQIVRRKGLSDIAASQAKVEQAKAGVNVANANRAQNPAYAQNIAALRSSVSAAEAQLRQAQSRLSDTVLKSTIKGTVTKRNADPGALATPGQAVLEVQFLDWIYVTASLPIEQTANAREGQMARIQFDALPGQIFQGPITNVNAAADPLTRQFSIRIKLDNPKHLIRPGMYAKVSLETARIPDATIVPLEAVDTTPKGSTVTVVDATNTAHVRPVQVGATGPEGVQIRSGVEPGEKVVILSYTPVKDGAKVALGGPKGGPGAGPGGPPGQGGGRRRRQQQ